MWLNNSFIKYIRLSRDKVLRIPELTPLSMLEYISYLYKKANTSFIWRWFNPCIVYQLWIHFNWPCFCNIIIIFYLWHLQKQCWNKNAKMTNHPVATGVTKVSTYMLFYNELKLQFISKWNFRESLKILS